MGLFDRLFRKQPGRAGEKAGEKQEAPDPEAFLRPRDFPARTAGPTQHPPGVAPLDDSVPGRRAAAGTHEIVVTLGDVLGRIPPQFLMDGSPDPRRELRFGAGAYFADMARGRVTVALSSIAARCADIFRTAITDDDDREIRLPLQKVLDQLLESDASAATAARAREPERPSAVAIAPLVEPSKSAIAAQEMPSVAAGFEGGEIRLSLAAIVAGCPDAIFAGERPRVEDAVRVSLPFAPIERQLAGGAVEITLQRFVSLLPSQYAASFQVREDMKVPLPLDEIFLNLPGNRAPDRTASPLEPSPAPMVESAAVLDMSSPAPVPPTPTVPKAGVRPAFRFFSPTPPIPRTVAPPPLVARAVAAEEPTPAPRPQTPGMVLPRAELLPAGLNPGSADEDRSAAARIAESVPLPPAAGQLPAVAPPLRSLELHAASVVPHAASVLQSASSEPSPPVPGPAGDASLAHPPAVRPLVVLPPPIGGALSAPPGAESGPLGEIVEPAIPVETTADQTAVLEFLSGAPELGSAPDTSRTV